MAFAAGSAAVAKAFIVSRNAEGGGVMF